MLNKSALIRVFFGLPFPEEKAEAYRDLVISKNLMLEHRVRWTKEGNHHITVRFLGNVAEQKIPLIVDAVEQAIQLSTPFTVTLRSIAAFPGAAHTRLVAINIQPSVELQSLHDAIELAIVPGNFPKDERAYLPHVTLFRPRNHDDLEFDSIPIDNEKVDIDKLILYQSVSVEKGNLYVPLNTFSFTE